jgi:hypothetical protein
VVPLFPLSLVSCISICLTCSSFDSNDSNESQLANMGEVPMESTDGLKHCDVSGQGDEVSPTTMVVNKDGLDKNIAESNEEHVRQIEIQETRLSGNKGTTRGAR